MPPPLLKAQFVRHVLAMLGSAGFLAAVPVLLYVGMIVWHNDMGGPLNIVIVPIGSAILGMAISGVLFVPLGFMREHRRVRYWVLAVAMLAEVSVLVVLPAIWFYGFNAPAKTPVPTL